MAGNGEGSSKVSGTLDDVMRAPSVKPPDIVVVEAVNEAEEKKEKLDFREDLWLSSADGRFNSPIIPLRVGEPPNMETFHAHRDILTKVEWFRKTLCGGFKEAETQAIDLPDDDPAIFHFLVAFLYEGKYLPIKPVAAALEPQVDKGKGKETSSVDNDVHSDSSSSSSILSLGSNSSASHRRHQRARQREERLYTRLHEKHPGQHRPGCFCPQCTSTGGPPCWHCGAPRTTGSRANHPYRTPQLPRRSATEQPGAESDRIKGEDMRTWLLAYELNLAVYVLAEKYAMDGFKAAVARSTIDMLETAGFDAAQLPVLEHCLTLWRGVPASDPLLKMVFARAGFLQPLLWRRCPDETHEFLVGNPEVAAVILRETAARRELDDGAWSLPSMEKGWPHNRVRIVGPGPHPHPAGMRMAPEGNVTIRF